jgi:CHAT domain
MVEDGDVIRVAAISDSATVPERTVGVDLKLIDALVERSEAEAWKNWPRASRLLMNLVVPDDLRRVFAGDRPIVLELDRRTARLPWELLCACDRSDDAPEPLVVRVPVARQLRTTYSRVGLAAERRSGRVRALVIGDPGDPAKDHGLPGARAEALNTARLLAERDIDVSTFVGAPGHPEPGLPWADRLDVLAELLDGDYDIVHYAGHGSFDEANPDRAGWLFADGLLTARELAQASRVPDLVVASACLSARASTGEIASPFGTSINPTLADEFLRQGVHTYIGTGSRIPDAAATLFSDAFYKALLDERQPVGAAVRQARRVLFDRQAEFATLWASYQHYGDPRDGGPSNPG